MAKSKYADLGKDALVNEIKSRRASGRSISVDLRAVDDKLRAALDTDDLENGDFNPDAKHPEKPATVPPAASHAETGGKLSPDAEKPATVPPVFANVAALPASLRNQVAKTPETPVKPTQPSDNEFAAGTLARNKGDGMLYQVVKTTGDDFNKPVKCRVPAQESGHPGFYWEGSKAEFAEHFEKA